MPDKDQLIIAGAMGAGCSHLWTNDARHFGSFYGRTIGRVRVVSSIMLAEELMDRGWSP